MILVAVVVVGALLVPCLGGSLSRLATIRFRWPGAVVVALAVQILIISVLPTRLPVGLSESLHVASYVLGLAFLWLNRRVPGLWLIGIGGVCNFVAIDANGGVMPASRSALALAGRRPRRSGLDNSAFHPGEHLRFLGDVLAVPRGWPLADVFSVGDVAVVAGAAVLLHVTCRSRLGVALDRLVRSPTGAPDAPLSQQRH